MTKQDELDSLDAFIASLPADTYLRPWLTQVRHEVARCIRGDIFPDVSLAETAARVIEEKAAIDRYETAAKGRISSHAESIIAQAKRTAATVKAAACADAERTRNYLSDSIHGLRRALSEVA